jgi:hypothetical protein
MTPQRHQPSIPLLTQDAFTAVTLPDHVDIVIRIDRRRLAESAQCSPKEASAMMRAFSWDRNGRFAESWEPMARRVLAG